MRWRILFVIFSKIFIPYETINHTCTKGLNYNTLIDSFTDVTAYKGFEKNLIKTFGISIDKSELFSDNIVFGDICGFAGSPPHHSFMLDSLLQKRDAKTILSWLRSPNTEKQLYGLQGATVLKNLGYKIPAEDERIIKIIRQKKDMFILAPAACSQKIPFIRSLLKLIFQKTATCREKIKLVFPEVLCMRLRGWYC